jgi:hypothetical protein
MTTQEQEKGIINKSFENVIDGIYVNFIVLYTGSTNDQERDTAMATFKSQVLNARRIRDLAISLLPA